MHWLHAIDVGLFRFVNDTLSNPVFDRVMPWISGQGTKAAFLALVIAAGLMLFWKGGRRGRLCVLMLALVGGTVDGLLCNRIKHAVDRPRPFETLPDVRRPGSHPHPGRSPPGANAAGAPMGARPGRVDFNSMPSSHAANWFAATMVLLVYYRRSWRWMLPAALAVSFSRLYLGVHYPSDVLAGAILGAGYAAACLWSANALWQWAGRSWFGAYWERLPSLLDPDAGVRLSPLPGRGPRREASSPGQAARLSDPGPRGAIR